jgi:hypothetical protein
MNDLAPLPKKKDPKTAVAAIDALEYAGAGFENMRLEEQLTPFIAILHMSSPQCVPGDEKYLEGAQAGMLLNSATGALYEQIELLACWRDYQFSAWQPRDLGGGFRGVYQPDDPRVRAAIDAVVRAKGPRARFQRIPFRDPDGDEVQELVEQYNLGVIYGDPLNLETARRALIGFTSTRIGPFRAWMTAAADIRVADPRDGVMRQPAMWAHRWRMTTAFTENKKGKWFNPVLRLANPGPPQASRVPVDDPLFGLGVEFYTQWRDGQVKADYAQATADTDEAPF